MKALTLASLKMTHIVLQKKSFTELENVVLPCLEVAADLIHGEKDAVKNVTQIPLSDTTIIRRSVMLADDLKEQLVKKLRLAASFGIQLHEITYIGGEAQLIVYCRFPDLKEKTTVEHYLYCIQLGLETTAHNIFQKLYDFIIEEGIDWSRCKSVTTDGAKVMVGAIKGVVKKIQAVSPNCIKINCVIHREALVAKYLNKQSISQQGKGGDIFTSIGKINAFKLKVKKWKSNVEKRYFPDMNY
ncbi:protein FAM200A-like [Procambarus clarkii]|uniref:protein FAM200A-like n=1 Tax=Procambarus clarkii TaxID=6728 RepID=UPI00374467FE